MGEDGTTATICGQGTWRRIAPPDRRRETVAVVRAAVLIVAAALLWIGRSRGRDRADDSVTAAPWEIAFTALTPSLQRDVRELHEAAEEALRRRADDGRWPSVAQLAADEIAPFEPLPGRKLPRAFVRVEAPFAWQYVGNAPGERTLLLQVLEPRPGENEARPGVPLAPDERHRVLPDGTVLHVSFWIGPEAAAGTTETTRPAAQFLGDPALAGFSEVLRHEGVRR